MAIDNIKPPYAKRISPTRSPSRKTSIPAVPRPRTYTKVKLEGRVSAEGMQYKRRSGIYKYALRVADAEPLAIVDLERRGVKGDYIKELSQAMGITIVRLYSILGLAKATAEKKIATGAMVAGSSGHAAIAMTKLLGVAQQIVENSTSPEAKNFDAAKWLGKWIEQPQPSLGGRKPSELIDTPTGVEVVARVLGAMESGAYQ